MAYCTASDLYLFGLPKGSLAVSGRLVEAANASNNTIELDAHGFAADDVVQFRAAGGGSLPSPIVEGTSYYVIVVSDWRFSVALTAGGSAIDLTTSGSTFLVLQAPATAQAIAKAERMIDDMLPAHVVPVAEPVPDIVRMTCAELAASDLLAQLGASSVSLTAVYDAARKRLERWARNVPIRGTNAPQSAQRAAYSATGSLPPWRRYGGIA